MVLYHRLKSQLNEAFWKTALFLPAAALWLLHGAYVATVRWRPINEHLTPHCLPAGHNVIYVFWHSKTFVLTLHGSFRGVATLTLLDWKNRIFDQICRFYGIRTVPVRSDAASALALERLLKQGYHIGLALNGPRGPAGNIRPGALYLARKTGRPIVCVNLRLDRSVRLRRRWDRLEIPLPFGSGTATLSPPIEVNERNMEEAKQKILEALPDL